MQGFIPPYFAFFPFLFWMLCAALEIFVPLQGTEPMSRALGV